MAARRCSECAVDWPTARKFSMCPACGCKTAYMSGATPITADEAASLVNQALFEAFYEEHDAKREGPTPEELGRADALAVLELEAMLREGNESGTTEDPS